MYKIINYYWEEKKYNRGTILLGDHRYENNLAESNYDSDLENTLTSKKMYGRWLEELWV